MKNKEFLENLKNYIKARYPLIFIETTEEDRLVDDLKEIGKELEYHVTTWSIATSLACKTYNLNEGDLNFPEAVVKCNNLSEKSIRFLFVFKGVNLDQDDARLLKEIAGNIRGNNKYRCNYIFIGASFKNLDRAVSSEATILEYPLLDKSEIKEILLKTLTDWEKQYREKVYIEKSDKLIDSITNATIGLTSIEIENSLAKILVKHRKEICEEKTKDIIKDIIQEKKQIVRKTGILEYIDNTLSLQDIGGLDVLKNWLNLRKLTFSEDAQNFGLTPPKGVLLVGIPGCGKSLTAKCIASAWNMPLLRFDIGKVFSKWLGESEANMRDALKIAETIASCVLWIDEIEKGLEQDGNNDETTKRIFGNILSWMQDKIEPVFVFATANNINKLPPEFLRKGRFDEIFFVDLPDFNERKKILKIHINKINRNITLFDIDELAKLSGEENLGENIRLSGAEIEAWVKDSLMEAYARRIKGNLSTDLSMDDFYTVLKRMVPMAKMRMNDFQALRTWAKENAINASTPSH